MKASIYARLLRVLLCLLAVATSASAECAWVLWEQAVISSGGPDLLSRVPNLSLADLMGRPPDAPAQCVLDVRQAGRGRPLKWTVVQTAFILDGER